MKVSNKLVRGIGTKGEKYSTIENKYPSKEYNLWTSMLLRCTEDFHKKHKHYHKAYCSENFKSYTFFYEWCQEQAGFGNVDNKGNYWQLDKDLLFEGNKLYSEQVCVFVPHRINSLLTKRKLSRGEYPIGVTWCKRDKKFLSRCGIGSGGVTKWLGFFNTPQEAFLAYKTFKEALIKEVANEYKEQLDSRVYEALMNYKVNEND